MKTLFILILLNFVLLQCSFAQTVILSNPIDNKESGIPKDYIGNYNGKSYFTAYNKWGEKSNQYYTKKEPDYFLKIITKPKSGENTLEVFSFSELSFKKIWNERRIVFEKAYIFNDSLTVFYSNFRFETTFTSVKVTTDELNLYASRISLDDINNLNAGRHILITKIKLDEPTGDRNPFNLQLSSDKSRIQYYHCPIVNNDESVKINYGTMKADITDIITSSVVSKFESKNFYKVIQCLVTTNGHAFFVLSVKEDGKRRVKGYIYSHDSDEFKTFDFKSRTGNEESISSINFNELNDGRILLLEFRCNYEKSSKDKPTGTLITGIFGRIFDGETFEETSIEPALLSKKNINDFDIYWSGEKIDQLNPVYFQSIDINSPIIDGDNLYITGQNFYSLSSTSKSGSFSADRWYGIFAAKLSLTNNEFDYVTTIPNAQVHSYPTLSPEFGAEYYGHAAIPIDGKLVIIFNDDKNNMIVKKNKELKTYNMKNPVYKIVTIEKDGKKSEMYFEPNANKMNMVITSAAKVDDNIIILGNDLKKKLNTIVTISPKI